ncbi:GNAT family N-acetyltransferase [Goodfellowiella coeruleoviolacea]|uniref:Acetyltransferase (GNAT) family protein n=1 Tax=Goodfellowiella coeruleoviolacea TaxID=334858 RepID=A0AAE3GBA2_9PSEU|nr:GNAT family N-acetyltransferase [Goodfellowiella coeruleoviolacea]MCP2164965.1 Acetyltransferase (GNAT) family protein [Goodfellowiella coeruleoviolacea]
MSETTNTGLTIRRGSVADVDTVLGLFDDAVRWLVSRGRTGQWGSEPFSTNPKRVQQVTSWLDEGELWLAEHGGPTRPAGALVVGPTAHHYVPASDVPELYVLGLVGSRQPWARGAGRLLLDHARAEAVRRGAHRLRVDCYAGDDRALVRFYTSAGFTPTQTFTVGEWPGQLLEIDLSGASAGA